MQHTLLESRGDTVARTRIEWKKMYGPAEAYGRSRLRGMVARCPSALGLHDTMSRY